MQVVETLSEGLKRTYKVVLPMDDLAKRLDDQLNEMKGKAQIKGFRPGKVPVSHLKKMYGKSVMADVLQSAVNEVNQKIISENGLKLAGEPKIDIDGGQDGVEKAIAVEGDLAFTVNLEVLPKFESGEFSDISLERKIVEVSGEEVDEAIQRMADQSRPYTAKDGAATKGDKLKIDFAGKIEDVPFEGGTGTDMDVVLGSNSFIPGFEEQLEGVKAGESRVLTVKFPENYQAPHLAGKDASFDVTVKTVEAPGELVIDDEVAKKFGLDALDKLKDAVRADVGRQYVTASREKLKRELFDKLNEKYTFELPEILVTQEFNNIWQQVEGERKQSGKSFEDEGTTEEAARTDYMKIAERRVRLGLVLAQVGEDAKVEVTEDELTQAIVARARQYPGQEKAIWDFFRNNPQQVASIRAPIFEEKVVDVILGKAKVEDKTVSKEELLKADEADEAV